MTVARKKKPTQEEPEPDAPPKPDKAERRARRRDTMKTVAQVASAIRRRDELLEAALSLLHGAGLVSDEVRDRVWAVYQRGDARTRLFIQELVARVLNVPFERLDEVVESGRVDDVSKETLERLESLSTAKIDIDLVAQKVRSFDVERFIAKGGQNRFVRFVGDLPVHANRLRLGMLGAGALLVVVAVAALAFPQYALWIALYGFIGFLAVVGALLVRWGVLLGRAAKAYDIDLAVYARLDPEERQILLLRRVYLGLVDTERLGEWVERGLLAVVPADLQAGRGASKDPATDASRPKRARRATRKKTAAED